MKRVRLFWHSKSRGMRRYGTDVTCTYGTKARVYDSSAGSAPHVWLLLKSDPNIVGEQPEGEAAMHLDRQQAQALVDRLSTWLEVTDDTRT